MRATPHPIGYTWFLVTEVVDDLLRYPVSRLRSRPATAPETQTPAALCQPLHVRFCEGPS
jgi:hypothetical protein